MNHDENKPDLQAWIEPELEARLVAWVLGEASAFEAAELERLVGEKPELAIFKRRIEAVSGLIGRATRPEQAPMRLAPERRAKILQTIGAVEKPGNSLQQRIAKLPRVTSPWSWRSSRLYYSISGLAAACLVVLLLREWRGSSLYEAKASIEFERPEPTSTTMGVVDQSIRSAGEATRVKAFKLAEPQEAGGRNETLKKAVAAQAPRIAFNLAQPEANLSATIEKRREERTAAAPVSSPRDSIQRPAPTDTLNFVAGSGDSFGGGVMGGAAGKTAAPAQGSAGFGGGRGGGGGGAGRQLTVGASTDSDLSRFSGVRAGIVADALTSRIAAEAPAKNLGYYTPPPSPTLGQDKKADNSVITLSPFEVFTSKDVGYAAGNTLSGTRLNTKLEDLASSVRVVTKQQLADTSALNVNDVFLAEAGAQAGGKTPELTSTLFAANGTLAPTSPAAMDERLSKENAAAKTKAPTALLPEPARVEISTAKEPVSTFSLHVSDVSFRLAQAALARGDKPDPTRIRAEEFYNAFDYGDPTPTTAEKISCRIEQSAHPLLQQRNLVRIAMKVPATGRGAGQPLHLTILLDTSGSMEREDRVASVRRALEVLASLLGPNDRVTLIGFAQQSRLLVEQLPGNQAAQLAALAASTPYSGGTNMEEALKLARELALRHRDPAAQNRVVLLTDGAANLGNAEPAQLATLIETLRQQGIAFDACGVGTDGLDDAVLEALTRKGDGRYYVLDKPEDADAGFARQLAGAFRPAAENVKVQVRFNPARVGRYRLIGFEQHRLREEDFRNDKVDAAELAAEEAAVAVYQIEVLPQGEGELGDVFVRFRDAATGEMVERSWTMLHDPRAAVFVRATPTMQLAGTAALLAEKLGGGPAAELVDLAELAPVVNGLRGHFANDKRVQELVTMFEQLRRLNGK